MEALSVSLFSSLQWEPTTEFALDTAVGDAIAEHFRQTGVPVPADEMFQAATWSVPFGTELQSPEWAQFNGSPSAPALRVDFANGIAVVLLVGWSDMCGCETCAGKTSLRVVEVHRG